MVKECYSLAYTIEIQYIRAAIKNTNLSYQSLLRYATPVMYAFGCGSKFTSK